MGSVVSLCLVCRSLCTSITMDELQRGKPHVVPIPGALLSLRLSKLQLGQEIASPPTKDFFGCQWPPVSNHIMVSMSFARRDKN